MARSTLSTWPLVLFGVIEPAMLVWAYVICLQDPFSYYASQAPNHSLSPSAFGPQARSVTLQLGNVLLLLAAMAVVCCWTPNPATARWYLVAVAFADYGHVYAVYRGVGADFFWTFAEWNDMMWGNVGVSLFLNMFRWLTVVGAFGGLGADVSPEKKRA